MRHALGVGDPEVLEFRLDGDSVHLRDFRPEDEGAFVHWAADDAMYEYMAWRLADDAAARAEFERLLHHPERNAGAGRRHWYLAVLDEGEGFVGIAGFDHRRDGLGEFGWYLSTRYWGRGHATAATRLLLAFGFGAVGVPAVTATCDPENLASRRVFEKCGLALAGEETIETWRGTRPRLRFTLSA